MLVHTEPMVCIFHIMTPLRTPPLVTRGQQDVIMTGLSRHDRVKGAINQYFLSVQARPSILSQRMGGGLQTARKKLRVKGQGQKLDLKF